MRRRLVFSVWLGCLAALPASPMSEQERRDYLQQLQQILPDVPAFREWLRKTGELPPDFDALPRRNDLPDPLEFLDGRPVRAPRDWTARRREIQDLFQKYVLGSFPPRPKIGGAVITEEARGENCRVRRVSLEFNPGSPAKLRVEIFLPDGKGPFPVFLVPGARAWAQQAVRRGYLCAIYAGNDFQDDAGAVAAMYPEYDLAQIPQRAWAGSIALDYVATLPEADMRHVGITGHSRDGKQALIAAAFDERITAVIPSSAGAGGPYPYRLGGERGQSEGIEAITRNFPAWFHPRLRFFSGREDRLPVDGNLLVALVAPRSCLLSFALNDSVEGAGADEQTYFSALRAYRLLGHPERLGVRWRPGGHGIAAADIEEYLDWLDIQFGRSGRTWVSNLIYEYDFDRWRARSGEQVDLGKYPPRRLNDILADGRGGTVRSPEEWERKAAGIRRSVEWMLGERPPRAPNAPPPANVRLPPRPPAPADDLTAQAMRAGASYGWRKPESDLAATQLGVRFGQGLTGDLFYPAAPPPDTKMPAVVWLHSYGYATGYWWAYRRDLNPILALVKAGYAVFAFDQIGFGRRILEGKRYSERFPRWSRLGQMIDDTRAAIDLLETHRLVDPRRIYLFGYSLGATLGIYTAALEARVQGLVAVSGFTPMRLDTADRGAGGVARYSRQQDLLPRLGFFAGHEAKIPYDFHELLGAIAPRPALVVQPQLDRDAHPADVRAAVEEARQVYSLYGASGRLALHEPWDYNRLPEATQEWIIQKWMAENLR
jgi:pimeloyl-ACP methyl ester carboxylesterase